MKYRKPLNLWATGVQEQILSGAIKIQTGQWLKCGNAPDKLCRYVSHNGRTINVTHWQGSAAETNQLFQKRIKSHAQAQDNQS